MKKSSKMAKQNQKICCICGKVATNYHKSIMGQIIFDVCEKHYLTTRPGIGFCNKLKSSRMGLLDRKGSFVDLKYWER